MTKVILLGDCHGKYEVFDSILRSEEPFDFFLCVGDVEFKGGGGQWSANGYMVTGNHDTTPSLPLLATHQEIKGLSICGLNGMLKTRAFSKELPRNVCFREILYASHLKDVDILVTHQPPAGLHDGMGEDIYKELVQYMVPRIYISGHIHKYRLKFYLNTFMFSLPIIDKGYAVAYFEEKELKNLEVVLKKGKKQIRI